MLKELNTEYAALVKKNPKAFEVYKQLVDEKTYRLLAGHTYSLPPEPFRQEMKKVCTFWL